MARNITRPLTPAEARIASDAARTLAPYVNGPQSVIVDFVKRDGTPRTLAGRVVEFIGADSTSAVVIDTDAGPRSANLYNITGIRIPGMPEVH